MEFLDIARRIRMIRQPLDMIDNHPAIFLGEYPDEFWYTVFDSDPHDTSRLEPEFLFSLFPRDEIAICVNLIEVPFQCPSLMFGDEVSYGIT